MADGPCDSAMCNMFQLARAQFLDTHSQSWTVIFKPEAVGATDSLLLHRSINPSMILTWQCPIALMAWSWVSYSIAIVVLIAKPFMPANNDTDERKVTLFIANIERHLLTHDRLRSLVNCGRDDVHSVFVVVVVYISDWSELQARQHLSSWAAKVDSLCDCIHFLLFVSFSCFLAFMAT